MKVIYSQQPSAKLKKTLRSGEVAVFEAGRMIGGEFKPSTAFMTVIQGKAIVYDPEKDAFIEVILTNRVIGKPVPTNDLAFVSTSGNRIVCNGDTANGRAIYEYLSCLDENASKENRANVGVCFRLLSKSGKDEAAAKPEKGEKEKHPVSTGVAGQIDKLVEEGRLRFDSKTGTVFFNEEEITTLPSKSRRKWRELFADFLRSEDGKPFAALIE